MKRLKTRLLFISTLAVIWGIRWVSYPSPLPPSWTEDARVSFTARILQQPEHTDSKTIIVVGVWTIKLDGYAEIKPGSVYRFVGKVTPELLLGKASKIEMVEPAFMVVEEEQRKPPTLIENVLMLINTWRERMVLTLEKALPEPHASLSAGILLGVKAKMPYEFYQALVSTGTLHIIAASGFNVTVVATAIMWPLLLVLSRPYALTLGILGVLIYVILAGAGAAIVRAGVMGSLTYLAYIWGRQAEAKRLLWITSYLMIMAYPLMVAEVSFQLSATATAGLLYLEPVIRKWLKAQGFLANYLTPTLAATVSTLPVLAWHFGRIGYLGPLVNMLVLPVVPLIMLLSASAIALSWVPIVEKLAFALLYVPLEYLILVIRWWG